MKITQEDISKLEDWAVKGDAPYAVREWHAQVILELVDYIKYLETELGDMRIKNANLDEELRFTKHEPPPGSTS